MIPKDVFAADRYWVASSAGNWNSSANWSETSGGAGGATVPESGDSAFFDAGGSGNCTIAVNVAVDRITVAAAYTGVVVQGSGVTVMAGALALDGTFRMGANGKLQLTETGAPLTGAGTLDTTANTPNTVEYTGGEEVELAAAAPVTAYHHLTLTPPGGISRSAVFVGNANEQYFDMAVVDSAAGFLYIGTKNAPAKIVKIRLSDFTRVGTLTLGSGENDLSPAAVLDSAGGFLYAGTRTSPAKIVKINLADFTRVGALTLNAGENQLWTATLDSAAGRAYFGSRTSPGVIVKINLSDFTREAALTLASGENEVLAACMDETAGFAYFGLQTYPGKVVKVRLSDFTKVGALTFNSGEDRIRVGLIDPANGYAYFGTRTSPGKVVRVKLADFTRDAVLTLNTGENELYSGVMDAAGGQAYFGTYTNPGVVVKVKLADFTRADAVTLGFNEKCLDTAAIDPTAGFAYFMTDNWTGKAVKVNLNYVSAVWSHTAALDVNGNFTIGAGTLNSAGQNLAVGGNWTNSGTFNPGLNTVTLDGGNQAVNGNNTFRNLTKVAGTAATLTFESGKVQQIAGMLNWQGAAGNLLSLRASTVGQAWRLAAENYQTARYVDVKDADASEGRTLVALQATDSGNNQNVLFSAPAQVAITTPSESVTNPAWVEGTNGGDVTNLTVTVNGGAGFATTRLSPTKWFADNNCSAGVSPAYGVVLSSSAATHVEVTAENDFAETNTTAQNITWTATDLAGKSFSTDILRIRKGDSLLLTATGSGTTLEIDGNGDDTYEHSGAPGDRFPTAYNTAGSFIVKAKIDSMEVGSLSVTVVSVNLRGPIACAVNFQREKDVDVSPASEAGNVTFSGNDAFWLTASLKQTTTAGATLYLKPLRRGAPILTARLNGATGPLLSKQAVDEYTLDVPARTGMIINDDTNIGSSKVVLRPFIPNVRVCFNMFASLSTFTGGTTSFSVNSSDAFEALVDPNTGETIGEYIFDVETPDEEDQYCFDVEIRQAASREVTVGVETGINGGPGKVILRPVQLCTNSNGNLVIVVTAVQNGKTFPMELVKQAAPKDQGPQFANNPGKASEKAAPEFTCAPLGEQTRVVNSRTSTGVWKLKIGETTFNDVVLVSDIIAVNLRNSGKVSPQNENDKHNQ
jgi:hypothetical protein